MRGPWDGRIVSAHRASRRGRRWRREGRQGTPPPPRGERELETTAAGFLGPLNFLVFAVVFLPPSFTCLGGGRETGWGGKTPAIVGTEEKGPQRDRESRRDSHQEASTAG